MAPTLAHGASAVTSTWSADTAHPAALSDADIRAWRDIFRSNPSAQCAFVSPEWAEMVGAEQPGAGVCVLRRDGEAVAFYPYQSQSKFLALPLGGPLSDRQGVVAAPGVKVDLRRVVDAIGVGRVDFVSVRDDEEGFAPYARRSEARSRLMMRESFKAYAEEMRKNGSKTLTKIGRLRRKLERECGELVFRVADERAEALDAMIALKREQFQRTNQTDIFARKWVEEVMRQTHASKADDCRGVLFTLEAGGKLVGANYCLASGANYHGWFMAHDRAFDAYSPGKVIFVDMIEALHEMGARELDLGSGQYDFKHSFSNAAGNVVSGFIGRASASSFLRGAHFEACSAFEKMPIGRVSHWPAKLMRRMDRAAGLAVKERVPVRAPRREAAEERLPEGSQAS